MHRRTLVAVIVLATLIALGACALYRQSSHDDQAPTHEVTIFPGADVTPTAPPPTDLRIVRPILPTVSATPQDPSAIALAGPAPAASSDDVPIALRTTHNLLVLGSDQRKAGQAWRTDVIMIVALDYAHNRMGVVSVPRDLYVKIPGVGFERINTADYYGSLRKDKDGKPRESVELLKETLRQNLGIPIHDYVRVDFTVFKSAVDALGGVTVTVDCPLRDPHWDSPGQRYYLEPGQYFMNGEDALRYVRARYTGTDLDRARRQQRILLALRDRALEVNLWPRLPILYREFRDKVVTDLGPLEIIELARFGLRLRAEDIHGFVIGRGMVRDMITSGGAMVLAPDYRKIRQALDGLFDTPPLSQTNDRTGNCP